MSEVKPGTIRIVYDRAARGLYEVEEYHPMTMPNGWSVVGKPCRTLKEAEDLVTLILHRRAEKELRKRAGTVVKVIEP